MTRALIFLFIFLQSCLAYGQELKNISAAEFLAENPSTERYTIVNFIDHQFDKAYRDGVTQEKLDSLWNDLEARQALHIVRFQIIDQKLYADSFDLNSYYFKPLINYFQNLLQRYKIKDVDFIIYARDELQDKVNGQKSLGIPAFMMSKNLNSIYEKDKFLLPDAHMIQDKRWKDLIPQIERANIDNPWDQKINKLFWRGGSTGSSSKYSYSIENFDKLARLKLVMLSKLYPDSIDAEITFYGGEFSKDNDGKDLKTVLNLLFGDKRERVQEVDHLKYKYIAALDGNTSPWVRVPWIMLSNSVLVKQVTGRVEWFYPALRPYTHYIPINKDLTDIFDKLEWLKANDLKAQQISLNAQNFIRNDLMPEQIEKQMVLTLNRYSFIQKDSKITASLPAAEETLVKIKDLESFSLKKIYNRVKQYIFN